MICPICKAETDGVNHNNRGLRCTACWERLPDPPEPALEILPEPVSSAALDIYDVDPGRGFDVGIVPDAVYEKLTKAGYETPGELWEASDEDLLAIRGIGEATLAKLRAHYGGDLL